MPLLVFLLLCFSVVDWTWQVEWVNDKAGWLVLRKDRNDNFLLFFLPSWQPPSSHSSSSSPVVRWKGKWFPLSLSHARHEYLCVNQTLWKKKMLLAQRGWFLMVTIAAAIVAGCRPREESELYHFYWKYCAVFHCTEFSVQCLRNLLL